jgi:hypothetical protein
MAMAVDYREEVGGGGGGAPEHHVVPVVFAIHTIVENYLEPMRWEDT